MSLIVHQNISDLFKALNLPLKQELDFSIHFLPDMHKELPFRSPVFRAEYFSFVFVKKGAGSYQIDAHEFSFQDRTLYFTNPGHIKAFHIQRAEEAYIITLSESFLRINVHPRIFDEFPFLLAETVPPKILPEDQFSEFETLYLQIFQEYHKDSPYKDRILGNLFVVLLLKIKEKFWQQYDPILDGDRDSLIVQKFKQLLEAHFQQDSQTTTLQAQDLAKQMNLHPNYLGQVIKSKTGKKLTDWIAERTTEEAKSLLKNTSLSAKEIAFSLGFSEATHFSRFFKKQTGSSPMAFRKSLS
ncbi:MAG: helix-turn-helix transcriptional regulator [Bacteroidota bacterium]